MAERYRSLYFNHDYSADLVKEFLNDIISVETFLERVLNTICEVPPHATEEPPWGRADQTERVGAYTVAWNGSLGYASVTQIDEVPVTYVCQYCGSNDVISDAYATWNEELQMWEIETLLQNSNCEVCEGATKLEEKELNHV